MKEPQSGVLVAPTKQEWVVLDTHRFSLYASFDGEKQLLAQGSELFKLVFAFTN